MYFARWAINPLRANPTKLPNTLEQFAAIGDELIEYVWPFCGAAVFKGLTLFAKSSILDVWQGFEYTSERLLI